jgi:four helix bundle protein
MTKIEKFEDLLVWQKTRELVNILYELTIKFPKEEKFNLIDQIRRAIVSVMANIAEGFSRYHKAETIQFYRNARGSLTEVKSLLYICFDREYVDKETLNSIFNKIDEVGKMLNGLIKVTGSYRRTNL